MHTMWLWRAAVVTMTCGVIVGSAAAQGIEPRTMEFESAAVERTMRYNILLPTDYEDSSRRYPVLYLLHGRGGNYVDWGVMSAPFYAQLYDDLIIVMPDAGNSSYVNWAESEDGRRTTGRTTSSKT